MKAAIYLADGYEQLVLTPETDLEKAVLDKLHGADTRQMSIHRGGFYHCQGGWVRHANGVQAQMDSTIFVMEQKK